MMDKRLKELKDLRGELARLNKDKERTYAFWNAWKYYAQSHAWFDDFIHDERIPWEELKYRDANGEVAEHEVSYDHGVRLWGERKRILGDLRETESQVDEIMKDLWRTEVSLEDIAAAYGTSITGAYNYMKRRPWFEKRKPLDSTQEVA